MLEHRMDTYAHGCFGVYNATSHVCKVEADILFALYYHPLAAW